MRFGIYLLALGLCPGADTRDPTADPDFIHPLVKEHGGIVVLPDAAHQPKKNAKVLLDITSDEKSGKVLKGLDRAALILNLYARAGAGAEDGLKVAIILHGPATKAALSDDAYAKHSRASVRGKGETKNPNLALMRQLATAGVQIYVCGQALARQGYATKEVAPQVTVAVSATTVNINLQMDGYAYIPSH